ncbi:MAG: helix-turn-helix domain-containing protein [Candidatus Aminicenantes bacterium]|nr:helix-turn-helix domain-containing protein [Candidatus Aminicenantes bacterium]
MEKSEIFEQNRLLTAEEVAEGLNVRPSTIITWVSERRIPFIKFGKGQKSPLRFKPKALNLWIDENSMEAGAGKKPPTKKIKPAFKKKSENKMIEDFEEFIKEIEKSKLN